MQRPSRSVMGKEMLMGTMSALDDAHYQSRYASTVGGSRLLSAAGPRTKVSNDRDPPSHASSVSCIAIAGISRQLRKSARATKRLVRYYSAVQPFEVKGSSPIRGPPIWSWPTATTTQLKQRYRPGGAGGRIQRWICR